MGAGRWPSRSTSRAASEWGEPEQGTISGPIELIEFYRLKGARFVSEPGSDFGDDRRKALHEMIRQRYKVLVDHPSVIIAELNPSETAGHGQ